MPFAVWPWSWLTALAPLVSRSEKAVMSNWLAVAVHAHAEVQHVLDRHVAAVEDRAGDAPHEVRVEALVPGRDRRVDREDAVAADLRPGAVEVLPGGDELAGPFGEQERRVAFVEVPDRRREPERADRPHAADAEHELLVEAHLAAADVQDVGDRAVLLRVLGHVRVEQQDRHAADLGEPDGDRELAVGERDAHRQRQPVLVLDAAQGQARQVVVGVAVLLVAVGVDRLAEVALAVEQPDADRREGHVAGRLHVVAGEHAEAARVDARATRGGRTRRRSRRSGRSSASPYRRWNQWSEPLAMYASNSARASWYSARNLASSRRRDQSTEPLMTGIGFR